jgi:hypothetical protein
MKPTFETQYQKIVSAYYRNELNPLASCACFIGNLLNNNRNWSEARVFRTMQPDVKNYNYEGGIACIRQESGGMYSIEEIIEMEKNFLIKAIPDIDFKESFMIKKATEDNLFNAMLSTLEMLRKIHESKGEIVKDYNFTKRELV